jgi:predicted TIM-barrel fold metal-dependent hydrolase
LQKIGSNARGIAVIDRDIGQSQLQEMHAMGIRGIRLNLETSGIQDPEFAQQELFKAAEQVQELGWHIQLYTNLKLLAALKVVIQQISVPIVVDHFCRAQAELGVDQPDLGDLLELVQNGRVWVKLSAPHRIAVDPDSLATQAIAQLFVNTNADQMLWGSDWPHPGGKRGQENALGAIEPFNSIDDGHALNRFAKWIDDPLLLEKILVSNPAKLYDF